MGTGLETAGEHTPPTPYLRSETRPKDWEVHRSVCYNCTDFPLSLRKFWGHWGRREILYFLDEKTYKSNQLEIVSVLHNPSGVV